MWSKSTKVRTLQPKREKYNKLQHAMRIKKKGLRFLDLLYFDDFVNGKQIFMTVLCTLI